MPAMNMQITWIGCLEVLKKLCIALLEAKMISINITYIGGEREDKTLVIIIVTISYASILCAISKREDRQGFDDRDIQ